MDETPSISGGSDGLPQDFTQILSKAAAGDAESMRVVLDKAYDRLRAMAAKKMAAENAAHTLCATALVHEIFLAFFYTMSASVGARMIKQRKWSSRAHFFREFAEAMRTTLIDHARTSKRHKRGGDRSRVPLDMLNVVDLASRGDPDEIMALENALRRLEQSDAFAGRVVELRFYAGLTAKEVAIALEVSPETVKRAWQFARAFLFRELGGGE